MSRKEVCQKSDCGGEKSDCNGFPLKQAVRTIFRTLTAAHHRTHHPHPTHRKRTRASLSFATPNGKPPRQRKAPPKKHPHWSPRERERRQASRTARRNLHKSESAYSAKQPLQFNSTAKVPGHQTVPGETGSDRVCQKRRPTLPLRLWFWL